MNQCILTQTPIVRLSRLPKDIPYCQYQQGPVLSRSTKPSIVAEASEPAQLFAIHHSSASEASIWPVGVQRIEWKHGCAGEVWQHCFTLAGVINSEAIKTRWRAAEVSLTLCQPRRAQLCQKRDLSFVVNLLSCAISNTNRQSPQATEIIK